MRKNTGVAARIFDVVTGPGGNRQQRARSGVILLVLHSYQGFALHDVDDLIPTVFFLGAGVATWRDGHDGGLAPGGAL